MTTAHADSRERDSSPRAGALLTVTVDEDGTVFSGLANVHRYDQPSASDIVSYVRSVLGEDPQWAPVHLVAESAILQQIIHAFGDYEVELSCDELPGGEAQEAYGAEDLEDSGEAAPPETATQTHPVTSEWEELGCVPIRRPEVELRRTGRFGAQGYLLVGVVGLVAAVCAAAIWFVSGRGSAGDETANRNQISGQTTSEISAMPFTPADSAPSGPPPEQQEPEKVTLEQDGLSMELPAGFHLEPDGDMWRATGADPDFRVQLAVDPLYGVAPDAVMRQVMKDIEDDVELRPTASDDGKTHYEHDLPDGSHAQWTTWAERGVQISIGCHTREAPTTVQLAACAMANESARFTPPE